MQYIAHEINADEDEDQLSAPPKEQLEQEKQMLLAFKPVMQKFLHDHMDLQVSALYALQVHSNAKAFPKGTLQCWGLAAACIHMESLVVFDFCYTNLDVKQVEVVLPKHPFLLPSRHATALLCQLL